MLASNKKGGLYAQSSASGQVGAQNGKTDQTNPIAPLFSTPFRNSGPGKFGGVPDLCRSRRTRVRQPPHTGRPSPEKAKRTKRTQLALCFQQRSEKTNPNCTEEITEIGRAGGVSPADRVSPCGLPLPLGRRRLRRGEHASGSLRMTRLQAPLQEPLRPVPFLNTRVAGSVLGLAWCRPTGPNGPTTNARDGRLRGPLYNELANRASYGQDRAPRPVSRLKVYARQPQGSPRTPTEAQWTR